MRGDEFFERGENHVATVLRFKRSYRIVFPRVNHSRFMSPTNQTLSENLFSYGTLQLEQVQ